MTKICLSKYVVPVMNSNKQQNVQTEICTLSFAAVMCVSRLPFILSYPVIYVLRLL